MFLEFQELTKEEKNFYRNFYPSIESLYVHIDKFKKEHGQDKLCILEIIFDVLFNNIKKMEEELVGQEVSIYELKKNNNEKYSAIYEQLLCIRSEAKKQNEKMLVVAWLFG